MPIERAFWKPITMAILPSVCSRSTSAALSAISAFPPLSAASALILASYGVGLGARRSTPAAVARAGADGHGQYDGVDAARRELVEADARAAIRQVVALGCRWQQDIGVAVQSEHGGMDRGRIRAQARGPGSACAAGGAACGWHAASSTAAAAEVQSIARREPPCATALFAASAGWRLWEI